MRKLKSTLKVVLAACFIAAGANHFLNPGFYMRMMPPYLPLHRMLVDASGIAEVVLGVLLLVPRTSTCAAWGMIALLLAVFPANVQMALHPETFPEFSPMATRVRLPLQGLLIAWAFWHTRWSRRAPVA